MKKSRIKDSDESSEWVSDNDDSFMSLKRPSKRKPTKLEKHSPLTESRSPTSKKKKTSKRRGPEYNWLHYSRKNKDKVYYDAVEIIRHIEGTKDVFQVGDFILLLSEDECTPFVGCITELFERIPRKKSTATRPKEAMIRWFYRCSDIIEKFPRLLMQYEDDTFDKDTSLFYSSHTDVNEVDTFLDHCVISTVRLASFNDSTSAARSAYKNSVSEFKDGVKPYRTNYVCRHGIQHNEGTISALSNDELTCIPRKHLALPTTTQIYPSVAAKSVTVGKEKKVTAEGETLPLKDIGRPEQLVVPAVQHSEITPISLGSLGTTIPRRRRWPCHSSSRIEGGTVGSSHSVGLVELNDDDVDVPTSRYLQSGCTKASTTDTTFDTKILNPVNCVREEDEDTIDIDCALTEATPVVTPHISVHSPASDALMFDSSDSDYDSPYDSEAEFERYMNNRAEIPCAHAEENVDVVDGGRVLGCESTAGLVWSADLCTQAGLSEHELICFSSKIKCMVEAHIERVVSSNNEYVNPRQSHTHLQMCSLTDDVSWGDALNSEVVDVIRNGGRSYSKSVSVLESLPNASAAKSMNANVKGSIPLSDLIDPAEYDEHTTTTALVEQLLFGRPAAAERKKDGVLEYFPDSHFETTCFEILHIKNYCINLAMTEIADILEKHVVCWSRLQLAHIHQVLMEHGDDLYKMTQSISETSQDASANKAISGHDRFHVSEYYLRNYPEMLELQFDVKEEEA